MVRGLQCVNEQSEYEAPTSRASVPARWLADRRGRLRAARSLLTLMATAGMKSGRESKPTLVLSDVTGNVAVQI
jgi:hypothetical protein